VARSRSIALPEAIATRPTVRAIGSASSSAFSPAANAATDWRSGCASITASALRPMDPVDPRMAMRFILGARGSGLGTRYTYFSTT
jgi:hypothetical protein